MNPRRVFFIAACLIPCAAGLFAAGPASAQFQPQQAPADSPWDRPAQGAPGGAPWPGQGAQQQPLQQQQQQLQQACVQEFMKLRDVAQKKAQAIRAASERKADAKTACGLFNAFSDSELKMIKYATDNATKCNIPPEIIGNLKQGHAKSSEIRVKICQAAAAPAGPRAPSLSDALSAPIPDSSNIKTGGTGTFDTLTGTPLGGK
jgi:hypothetical protein